VAYLSARRRPKYERQAMNPLESAYGAPGAVPSSTPALSTSTVAPRPSVQPVPTRVLLRALASLAFAASLTLAGVARAQTPPDATAAPGGATKAKAKTALKPPPKGKSAGAATSAASSADPVDDKDVPIGTPPATSSPMAE